MDPTLQTLLTVAGNGVMGAVVVWVVHTLLSKTLPQMEDRAELRQGKILDFCSAIMQAERDSCEKRHLELMEHWRTLTLDQKDNHRQNQESQQELRHFLKDVAHAVNLRSLAERAQQAIDENGAGTGQGKS